MNDSIQVQDSLAPAITGDQLIAWLVSLTRRYQTGKLLVWFVEDDSETKLCATPVDRAGPGLYETRRAPLKHKLPPQEVGSL